MQRTKIFLLVFLLSFLVFSNIVFAKNLTVYDDDETFWNTTNWGSGSIGTPTLYEELTIVKTGISSTKSYGNSGSGSQGVIYHDFVAHQNWGNYTVLTFWIYGANSGNNIDLTMRGTTGGDYVEKIFNDNFVGWMIFSVILDKDWSGWSGSSGNFQKTDVSQIAFGNLGVSVFYLDNLYVSDNIDTQENVYITNITDFFNATLFSSDQFISYISLLVVLIVLFSLSLKFYPIANIISLLVLLVLLTKYLQILNVTTGNFGYHILIIGSCLILFSLVFAMRKL